MIDPRAESLPLASAPAHPTRILIAEDDPASRRLLGLALEAMGYVVEVANDGSAAIAMVEANPPELILLDLDMPGLSGTEACQQLRRHDRVELQNIPIIMLTAHEGEDVACLRAGANDFITKPIGRGSLAARIETQVRLRALNEELRLQNEASARWRAAQVADLEAAQAIQRAILPSRRKIPGWKIAARFSPVIQVGGDMYGFEPMAGGGMVWIADAAGHGVAAALSTAMVALMFHRAATGSPAQVLARVNAGLFGIFEGRSIVSAMCAQFLSGGEVRMAGAGHPPLLIRRATGEIENLRSEATLLGISAAWSCPATSVRLEPGESALLYSDGLYSGRDATGQRQLPDDVVTAFRRGAKLPDLIETLRGKEGFDDDLTAILLQRAD